MSFQRGQGANNALKDALELCRAAQQCWHSAEFTNGEGTQVRRAAIDTYESEMKERGGREVQLSADNTRALHNFHDIRRSGLMKHGLHATGKENGDAKAGANA